MKTPSCSDFEGSKRGEALPRLVQRIALLPPTPKKILAMYYYENLRPAEIATRLGLTENEVEFLRAQTVRALHDNLLRDLCATVSFVR